MLYISSAYFSTCNKEHNTSLNLRVSKHPPQSESQDPIGETVDSSISDLQISGSLEVAEDAVLSERIFAAFR